MIAHLLLVPLVSASFVGIGRAPAPLLTGARPDTSFGAGRGWVTTEIPGSGSQAEAALVMPDNRIVVAGQSAAPNGESQVLVVRYRSDGTLDPSFGSNGIFKSSLPTADAPFNATAIAQQPTTGKLVVTGGYAQDSILLSRLTPAGQLDPTFGAAHTGVVRLPVGGTGEAMTIDGKGRILAGAFNANVRGKPMVVARFSSDGILDTSFGQNGIVNLLFWDISSAAGTTVSTLIAAADGSVTGFGRLDGVGSGPQHGAVFRLSPNGALAPGFGSGGHADITPPAGGPKDWYPCSMSTVDSRGRMVVTGGLGNSALMTARLSANGKIDGSYGTAGNGIVVTPVGGNNVGGQTTCGAALDATGDLTTGIGATLVQLTSRGAPDTHFGPGGFVTIGAPAQVNLNAVRNAGAARIVIAGFAGNAVYVARYWTR
ncbi:MAG TPA: hypothetical protein VM121_03680 [Acidimicrobiales bacterium]|nr:hypothetical protein [Acidimicrobiales bacterium]